MNVLGRNKDTIYNVLLLMGFIVILFLTFYKLGYASFQDNTHIQCQILCQIPREACEAAKDESANRHPWK